MKKTILFYLLLFASAIGLASLGEVAQAGQLLDFGALGLPLAAGMIINSNNLAILHRAFNTAFQKGFTGVAPMWQKIATEVPSTTGSEDYGWIGELPGMREHIGDRHVHNLSMSDYTIKNKKFELTVGVPEDKVEDDQYGVYAPLMESLGFSAAQHPDELIWELLAAGFETKCYDKQYYFDTDHPVKLADGSIVSVSNMQAGGGNPWFLLDTSRPLKPLILQRRRHPRFIKKDRPEDDNSFFSGKLIYGVDDRKNVGYGFWQMAYGSKAALTPDNFDLGVNVMGGFKNDFGKPLGLQPKILVVGNSNRSASLAVIEKENLAGGETNTNFKAVEVLVVPWLA